MIDLEFLESLIRAVDESSIDSVEIERGGTRVRVSKTPPASPAGGAAQGAAAYVPAPGAPGTGGGANPGGGGAAADPAATTAQGADEGGDAAEADDGLVEVTSPMVGTFYRAPAPDAPPYVETGDRIATGETLCIIEAMKLMNELDSEVAGTVAEVCVENAEPVEYGQVLFRIDPA